MGFWLRYSIIGIVLAVIAYLLLANQGLMSVIFGKGESDPMPIESNEMKKTIEADSMTSKTQETPEAMVKKVEKKSTNAAADGLSRFYASINPDLNETGPKIRNNVVFLPELTGDIKEILEAKDKVTRPMKKSWRGKTEARPFRNGETLYQKLYEYAQTEGVDIIWWLNRDFIIKDAFRINKNLLITAKQIGMAVEGHFEDGIKTYFCHSNRTIVLTDLEINYLDTNCRNLNNTQAAW